MQYGFSYFSVNTVYAKNNNQLINKSMIKTVWIFFDFYQ